jgi:hypothetical protein
MDGISTRFKLKSQLCRSEMKESGTEVLAGRARSVSAKHYLINELDKMVEQYDKGLGFI